MQNTSRVSMSFSFDSHKCVCNAFCIKHTFAFGKLWKAHILLLTLEQHHEISQKKFFNWIYTLGTQFEILLVGKLGKLELTAISNIVSIGPVGNKKENIYGLCSVIR